MTAPIYGAVVIGGGFYGAAIAIYLARQRGIHPVVLLEKETALLSRASYNNQARVHNGYHYPRSFTTAFRSRVNLPRFVTDWPDVVFRDFTKLYAIARRNSKVTARQFERFCQQIEAPLRPAAACHRALFDFRLIDAVYEVEEYAFDATRLALWASQTLGETGVEVRLGSTARAIDLAGTGASGPGLMVTVRDQDGVESPLASPLVFNCTYSGLNQLTGDFPGTATGLKQELTEMALLQVPEPLTHLGITVMDGPFFSLMPFPAQALHSLSHVRYTPHQSWDDRPGLDPYRRLADYGRETRAERMIRDAGRYLPLLSKTIYKDSLFEVKTLLTKNEGDDGRPILFERHARLPGCYSILGGKIDNIYDVLEELDAESLPALPGMTP